jgi:hypothetical protein
MIWGTSAKHSRGQKVGMEYVSFLPFAIAQAGIKSPS